LCRCAGRRALRSPRLKRLARARLHHCACDAAARQLHQLRTECTLAARHIEHATAAAAAAASTAAAATAAVAAVAAVCTEPKSLNQPLCEDASAPRLAGLLLVTPRVINVPLGGEVRLLLRSGRRGRRGLRGRGHGVAEVAASELVRGAAPAASENAAQWRRRRCRGAGAVAQPRRQRLRLLQLLLLCSLPPPLPPLLRYAMHQEGQRARARSV